MMKNSIKKPQKLINETKTKKTLTTLDKSSKHPLDLFPDTLITQLLELTLPTKSKHLVSGDYTFDLKKSHNSERLIVVLIKFVYAQIFFLNAFRLKKHPESTVKFFLIILNWWF